MKKLESLGKVYDIIYADPPWDYNNQKQICKGKITQDVKSHYNTLSIDKLKKLPIHKIANTNCLLFLWTSSPHLAQAISLGEEWGFTYSTIAFVWNKVNPVVGNYTMSYCEICLLFKKGLIPKPFGSRNEKQYIEQKKTTHSCKPHEVRDRITRMFPTQKKIELFARHKIPKWTSWGNEVGTQRT